MSDERALGRIEVPDDRDKNFPVSAVLAEAEEGLPDFPKRLFWILGLLQGSH